MFKVHMGGKQLSFVSLPREVQNKVLDKLASRDPVLAEGQKGILPGLKIDGKQVTRDNIKDFEIKEKPVKSKPEVKAKAVEPKQIKKKIETKPEVKTVKLKVKKKSLDDLKNVKGIGPETFNDIKRITESEEELVDFLKSDGVPLRNDVVKKLKKHYKVKG